MKMFFFSVFAYSSKLVNMKKLVYSLQNCIFQLIFLQITQSSNCIHIQVKLSRAKHHQLRTGAVVLVLINFALNLLLFCIIQLVRRKNNLNENYFDQRLGCAAPKGWSKYTTGVSSELHCIISYFHYAPPKKNIYIVFNHSSYSEIFCRIFVLHYYYYYYFFF